MVHDLSSSKRDRKRRYPFSWYVSLAEASFCQMCPYSNDHVFNYCVIRVG